MDECIGQSKFGSCPSVNHKLLRFLVLKKNPHCVRPVISYATGSPHPPTCNVVGQMIYAL